MWSVACSRNLSLYCAFHFEWVVFTLTQFEPLASPSAQTNTSRRRRRWAISCQLVARRVNPSTVTLATRLQEKEILPSSEGTRRQRRRSVVNLCLSLTFWMIPSVFSYHDCILIWNNKESQRVACLSADIFHRAVGPRRVGWRPCHQSQGAGGKWLM